MKKYIYLSFFALILAVFDLILTNRLFLYSYFLLAPVVLVLVSSRLILEEQLVFAFLSGLIYDIASLTGVLYMTVFLIFEIILIYNIRKRLIEFKSNFVTSAAAVSFSFLQVVFVLATNHVLLYSKFALKQLLLDILISALVAGIYFFAKSNLHYLAYIRERRNVQ